MIGVFYTLAFLLAPSLAYPGHDSDYGQLSSTITLADETRYFKKTKQFSLENQDNLLTRAPSPRQEQCTPLKPSNPSQFWLDQMIHNGQSSYLTGTTKSNYKVFRDVVRDFNADNTGKMDASTAIQNAITTGSSATRASGTFGTTAQPAVVYLPGGTYILSKGLQLYVGTIIIGDPLNPPVLKAAPNFTGTSMCNGQDPKHRSFVSFYLGIRNVVFDSTSASPTSKLMLLDWTVSQATQVNNVKFKMPIGSSHSGIATQDVYHSNLIIGDVMFEGGSVGINLPNGLQWAIKNATFRDVTTGIKVIGQHIVVLGCSFKNCTTGIEASGLAGSLVVIDSIGSRVKTFISSVDSKTANNSIALENISNVGTTVSLGGNVKVSGNVSQVWFRGSVYSNKRVALQPGTTIPSTRPGTLLQDGKYFTARQPSYQEYSIESFINIKNVKSFPVRGDGTTDDSASINAILKQYAFCKIIYFPAGTYIVKSTIFVPPGTRIIGDAFGTMISAAGSVFQDSKNPVAMIKIGNLNDVGVAQISDLLLTVAEVLPGCKLLEINMAGSSPGSVALWNTHFRIGGGIGSQVQTGCAGSPCLAAWGLLHLTASSSAYIENMWGWTADHDMDGNQSQNIATGRGALIEAINGTWLVATSMEHHVLYHYNFNRAAMVFSALQQTETPYWQGAARKLAPFPWTDNLIPSDPTFASCGVNDITCRMSWYQLIVRSKDIFLYGGSDLAFIFSSGVCPTNCQLNAIDLQNSTGINLYGINTRNFINVITDDGIPIVTQKGNEGGIGASLIGYLA